MAATTVVDCMDFTGPMCAEHPSVLDMGHVLTPVPVQSSFPSSVLPGARALVALFERLGGMLETLAGMDVALEGQCLSTQGQMAMLHVRKYLGITQQRIGHALKQAQFPADAAAFHWRDLSSDLRLVHGIYMDYVAEVGVVPRVRRDTLRAHQAALQEAWAQTAVLMQA